MRKRDLWERTDRGQLVIAPESVEEREARVCWERATLDCPREPDEGGEHWTARVKERAEELRKQSLWWEER
jgi:hypothetical protein